MACDDQRCGRVDDEDLLGGLVDVDRDVVALDVEALLVRDREELEVLEEAGLDRAGEGGEAMDGRGGLVGGLGWSGSVVEDALLEREGGAGQAPFMGMGGRMLVALPRGEGLVVAGDVEDVPLELALLDGLVGGVDGEPVAVAQAVGRGLGLGVPGATGRKRGVIPGIKVVCGGKGSTQVIPSKMPRKSRSNQFQQDLKKGMEAALLENVKADDEREAAKAELEPRLKHVLQAVEELLVVHERGFTHVTREELGHIMLNSVFTKLKAYVPADDKLMRMELKLKGTQGASLDEKTFLVSTVSCPTYVALACVKGCLVVYAEQEDVQKLITDQNDKGVALEVMDSMVSCDPLTVLMHKEEEGRLCYISARGTPRNADGTWGFKGRVGEIPEVGNKINECAALIWAILRLNMPQ
jgi:hypothetical protein